MAETLVAVLKRQTGVLLENVRETLETCDDDVISGSDSAWPAWKQFYHLLHSLDEWFIDPVRFQEPSIHQPHFRTSEQGPGMLSKRQLLDYFREIRHRVEQYLDTVNTGLLEQAVGDGDLTRFDLMLIQFRHVMHHVGYLHCHIKNETGASPRYIGVKRRW